MRCLTRSARGCTLTGSMGLLQSLRQRRRTRAMSRSLHGIHLQLQRIANTLDRIYPLPPAGASSVEIEDASSRLLAEYAHVEAFLRERLHREPTPDEVLAEHEAQVHLFDRSGRG